MDQNHLDPEQEPTEQWDEEKRPRPVVLSAHDCETKVGDCTQQHLMSNTDKAASVELGTRLQAETTMKWEYLRALVEAHSGSSGHQWSDVPSVIWVFHPDGTIQEWPKQAGEKSESPAVTRFAHATWAGKGEQTLDSSYLMLSADKRAAGQE